ncbi:MAG: Ca-activated chloride channel family protein, partial [Myxococcota bacterium]
ATANDALSTFSVDVDTASYSIATRSLDRGSRPDPSAVRTEEFINAQHYDYPDPGAEGPFAVLTELTPHPFVVDRHLLRVALQAERQGAAAHKPVRLTFLVDVSGSMSNDDKLPLAQQALHLLVDGLGPEDTAALATYAGRTEEVLLPTPAIRPGEIHAAIDALSSGGGTAMHSGFELAYDLAGRRFVAGVENRVVVVSDGDANLGPVDHSAMLHTIAEQAARGITLSTVGFGGGNYQDHRMEQLADRGDGNYSYIGSMADARRVFGRDLAATLRTVARDVKLQVAFDEAAVQQYRLVGYENRDIADADFRDDRVDAGEIGSGHTVTALYELQLADPSAEHVADVHLRWEPPGPDGTATERVVPVLAGSAVHDFEAADNATQLAVAAAALAEKLRGNAETRAWPWSRVEAIARGAHRGDPEDDVLVRAIAAAARLEAVAANR